MSGDPDRKGDGSDDHEDYLGEEEESDATTDPVKKLVLNRPDVLAALQVQNTEALPAPVKKRIKALKKIQFESTKIESKFYDEVYALERKYHLLYVPQYEKRAEIITGRYEPTEEECDWNSDKDEEEELSNELEKKVKIKVSDEEKKEESNKGEDTKGIPEFWLTIFKNVSILQEMMEDHDIPILRHLEDIKVVFHKNGMGFTLEFHFSPNEYFQNSVLTKEYEMKCAIDESDPFSFEGPEIIKSKGCLIEWAKGKNVTLKTVKKKQKHKGRGEVRIVTKTVRNDSFFNFFSPPVVTDGMDIDDETESLLSADFEIGHYIRDRIVPRAVLYYTGEALEEEEDEFEEEEGEEDSADDEDEDEELNSKNIKSKFINNKAAMDECKNQ
ncbi:UNVERIFIED_CONTAM: hypothetical protein PYX00_006064 [Menopon gallinae]|uniref:Nucleosome assembly protein 1-like 1 n=1 Tax=Menopon gallinae TaxID=328185 RepID=A0AAW2HV14_9NEOP